MVNYYALIGFGIYGLVLYIIGCIQTYREYDIFLKPDMAYIENIFNAFTVVTKAVMGETVPSATVVNGDAYYYNPTRDEFDEALLVTHQMMTDGGWTSDSYLKRAKDCEDFAMKMAVEVRNYIATTFTDNVGEKGVAVGLIAYTRDVDGANHAIVKAIVDSGDEYYEPYPGVDNLIAKSMSKTELESISMIII